MIIRPLQKRAETVWDITPRTWTANQETAVSTRGKKSTNLLVSEEQAE